MTLDFFVEYVQRSKYNFTNLLGLDDLVTLKNIFQAEAAYNISAEISVLNYVPDMTVESFFQRNAKDVQFDLLSIGKQYISD